MTTQFDASVAALADEAFKANLRVERARETHQSDMAYLGGHMRKLREGANVSLRELAHRAELSAPYISDLERGRRNWSPELVRRLGALLR